MTLDIRALYRAGLAAGLTLAATLGMSMASAVPVAAAGAVHHVTLTGFPTNPAFCVEGNCSNHSLSIATGDTVVWTYSDGACDLTAICPGHTVSSTSGPASFGSPTLYGPRLLNPSGPTTYSLSFGSPGSYNYQCAFHGTGPSGGAMHMNGVVVVTGTNQSAQSSGNPVVVPAGSSASDSGPGSAGNLPTSTSNSVPSDQLPNTFVPGLPVAGRALGGPFSLILAAVSVLATLPAALLVTARLATRRS